MASVGTASLPGIAVQETHRVEARRFSAVVRITHWLTTISFLGLLVSGCAILLAHPRLYWGETGALGTPYVIAFPLPFMKGGPSGWGRALHFLSAWVSIMTGLLYVVSGIYTQHFRNNLLPAKRDLSWSAIGRVVSNHVHLRRPSGEQSLSYNVLQRLTYLAVIFFLFPLVIWTGFAMSPGIVSVFPGVVTVLGGQETARTLHFFVASLLVLFLLVHVAVVGLAGFGTRTWAMITGRRVTGMERS